jgi:(1->4)-alpha-D-glucan 1-alpha-D-glucosylmutase
VTLFEQLTAPLAAKGLEDTALYRYPLLLSLNEVGGTPDRFGGTRRAFHNFMAERAEKQPLAMNGSSTHDSKRGEDVRARLNVLSEIPDRWRKLVSCWQALNKVRKIRLKDALVPDLVEEYFLYQTLVGSWPAEKATEPSYLERLENYMVKALREAKVHSSWRLPDENYEKAVVAFIHRILDDSDPKNRFMKDFIPFCRDTAYFGFFNTLSQTLFKIAAPGIPDFYQGTELLNLSLVDPDNRRPVDYEKRKKFLRQLLQTGSKNHFEPFPEASSVINQADKLKLFVVEKCLQARKQHRQLFESGSYVPLETAGEKEFHALAFARRHEDDWAVAVAPRFLANLITSRQTPLGAEIWRNTEAVLPSDAPGDWKNELTGQSLTSKNKLSMGEIFEFFPVALLTGRVEK